MIRNLALFVVLPMVLAQVVRLARAVGRWATRHTAALGVTAQLGILCIVYFASVQTAAQRFRGTDEQPVWIELVVVILGVTALHLLVLAAGFLAAARLGMARPEQIAVAIAGSQKTLAVGLQICMELGFHLVPVVAYHIAQLLLDTLIVDHLRKPPSNDRPTTTERTNGQRTKALS
jgi:predicted Na+-dependent transporter